MVRRLLEAFAPPVRLTADRPPVFALNVVGTPLTSIFLDLDKGSQCAACASNTAARAVIVHKMKGERIIFFVQEVLKRKGVRLFKIV